MDNLARATIQRPESSRLMRFPGCPRNDGWRGFPWAILGGPGIPVEAAEILGVSQGTLRAWAADGKIPVHRNPANGYRLFKRSDLDHFLKQVAASGEKKQTTSNKRQKD